MMMSWPRQTGSGLSLASSLCGGPNLPPDGQAFDQVGRQACFLHRSLCAFDVVGDPVIDHLLRIGIEDRVTGPWVAIARLADTPGICDRPGLAQLQSGAGPHHYAFRQT